MINKYKGCVKIRWSSATNPLTFSGINSIMYMPLIPACCPHKIDKNISRSKRDIATMIKSIPEYKGGNRTTCIFKTCYNSLYEKTPKNNFYISSKARKSINQITRKGFYRVTKVI